MEYFLNLDINLARAEVEESRVKDKDTLENWGVDYLPRASGSPNVVMEVFTTYRDDWDFRSQFESRRARV
ncbi:hypothetical protein M413DRAFT_443684 [Hebeloma cylindrosporum]|uniref:Uncharacterized protein n=1 Tax=Hebeloma cylindrosporum TaxID=76867 RepID=A0A0C3CJ80_HEBCY|nr:hypothetical protein M413DRAFT_443684 [Hebeloma cylindrosporum h7]